MDKSFIFISIVRLNYTYMPYIAVVGTKSSHNRESDFIVVYIGY